jgi:hypothetical protein
MVAILAETYSEPLNFRLLKLISVVRRDVARKTVNNRHKY